MPSSTPKTALVTGASGGIGRAAALRLAQDGFNVVVHYAGNEEKATAIVDEIKAANGNAVASQADILNAQSVETLFHGAINAFGRIDVVVNAAAVLTLKPLASMDIDTFDRMIATNLRGTFLVLRQAAKHIQDGGRIMAFSSSVVAVSFPGYGAYIASKLGVEGLVRVLANELRGRNITVNAVAP
ncbi:MAG: SDR family NAD(P)-dependent oxidoreductase, partial [Phycisphaerales bacterium]|nr:SDR family NAD(P)-dependent oxidoreductase [Phycisphaerales bacterium]